MTVLTRHQYELLDRIVDAGPRGLQVSDLAMGDVIGLAIDGLVSIDSASRRATATAEGLGFYLTSNLRSLA
jgi:hypothetical protein